MEPKTPHIGEGRRLNITESKIEKVNRVKRKIYLPRWHNDEGGYTLMGRHGRWSAGRGGSKP